MNSDTTQPLLQPQSHTVTARRAPKLRRAEALVSLRSLGADEYDLLLPETRYISQVLREGEVMLGAIYGKYEKLNLPKTGRGLLIITDRRILLVDKKPLFLQYDEIKFDMVSGVQYGKALIGEAVTLNTRMGNVVMRTFNDRCARHFVETVEDMLCFRDKYAGRV